MIAFVFSALTAIVSRQGDLGTVPFMSLSVGLLSLIALIAGELGDNSPVVKSIGLGGVERWVVFPMILWLASFGGYLSRRGTAWNWIGAARPQWTNQLARSLTHVRGF